MTLHYAPPGKHARWDHPDACEHAVILKGKEAPRGYTYVARACETEVDRLALLTELDPMPGQGHPVAHVTDDESLRHVLESISFPGDGHEPDETECEGSVNGLHLHNGRAWPLTRATHIGTKEPEAGCPMPQATPPGAELYITLHKEEEPVADVNLAALLGWVGGATEPSETPLDPPTEPPVRIHKYGQLAELLGRYSYPANGKMHTVGNEVLWSARVYGTHLDTAGFWPIRASARSNDPNFWAYAGCPRPVKQPAITELYMELHYRGTCIAYINLSILLAWAAWGA